MRHAVVLVLLAACSAPGQRSTVAQVVNVGTMVTPRPVEPPDAGEPTSEEWLTPCAEGTPEHEAADKELSDVAHEISSLPVTADPAAAAARLARLYAAPCFALGHSAFSAAKVDSALALRTYWNGGAHSALQAELSWANHENRWFWTPPSIRKSLTKDSAPNHPLAPPGCPALFSGTGAPSTCAKETDGWVIRAERAFQVHASAERARFFDSGSEPRTYQACVDASGKAPEPFTTFRECMERTPTKHDALPLGSFRAPRDGWLVLRGRRGHYSWCNELRAYDLATGTAYIASTCAAGAGQSAPKIEKGKLPLDALREAAWMIFLAGVTEHSIIARGYGNPIPDSLVVREPKGHYGGIGHGSFGSSSGRTTLVFQWIRGGKSIANGTVHWPDASRASEQHATDLLTVAEAGLVSGCAPAALPTIPWDARGDQTARIGGPDIYFPAWDEPDFTVLEGDLARARPTACP